eukprot:6372098-Lingulodinium_polyedra.AAC.1
MQTRKNAARCAATAYATTPTTTGALRDTQVQNGCTPGRPNAGPAARRRTRVPELRWPGTDPQLSH